MFRCGMGSGTVGDMLAGRPQISSLRLNTARDGCMNRKI